MSILPLIFKKKYFRVKSLKSYLLLFDAYKTRVEADSGLIIAETQTKQLFQSIEPTIDSIQFAWAGVAGSSLREDGILNYYTKLYDMGNVPNDATQTTSTIQPYLSGNIVPTERQGMNNPNGDSRYMTHPSITFADGDEWSVTTDLNDNRNDGNIAIYCGGSSTYGLRNNNSGRFKFFNGAGSTIGHNSYEIGGKNTVLTFVSTGAELKLYKNGILDQTITRSTCGITFSKFNGTNYSGAYFNGTTNAHIIRNKALDATQVLNEANFLLSVYPPIAYKTIETYDIATTSLDVAASSNGTVITEASDNTDWATGAARWRYYDDSPEKGSWGNKLYNKAARDVIIANPPDGWHVATEAQLTALAAEGGNALKVESTDYWSTANGTNSTGFSAVGSGMVNTDGTFTGINTKVGFWCADSDKALIITDAGAATITSVSANEGYSIRLIKDE